MRIDRLEAQNRNGNGVNAAELRAGIFDRKGQLGRQLAQSLCDHTCIGG